MNINLHQCRLWSMRIRFLKGALDLSKAQVMAPKSSIPCRRGASCLYYLRGTCHYMHKVKTDFSAEVKESANYHLYEQVQKKIASAEQNEKRLEKEVAEARDAIEHLKAQLNEAASRYNRAECKRIFFNKEQQKERRELIMLERKMTPCTQGRACDFYIKGYLETYPHIRTRSCIAFHTQEEIAFFEAQEEKRVVEAREHNRIEEEKRAFDNDKDYYMYRYCSLGNFLKWALASEGFPDEITSIVRSYCAQREFQQANPVQHFYDTFKREPKELKRCSFCPNNLVYSQDMECSLCSTNVKIDNFYLLYTVNENKVLVHFLHPWCTDLLGMARVNDKVSNYLKGDHRIFDNKDAEVKIYWNPSNFCYSGNHRFGLDGDTVEIPPGIEDEDDEVSEYGGRSEYEDDKASERSASPVREHYERSGDDD